MSAGYGKMAVVREVDLRVDAGEVVALIGANGAGKTTTLLTLAGELAPMEGEVRFLGEPTTVTDARAVPERPRLRDRGAVGDHGHVGRRQPEAGRRPAERSRSSTSRRSSAIMDRRAGLCSGGEQQMLSLARALGRHPKVLLADELSLGLAPIIVANLLQAVRDAADERGVGVLLVEQHVRQALKIADRVYVMERGRIVLSGTSDEVVGQLDKIEAAYLAGST